MNLILVFSRKYKWPEHCFFHMVLRKFSEITNNQPIFSQYNIFYNYKYFFFESAFYLFSIIAKKVNQIRNNVVCVVARLVFIFCCALTTGRCNAFQHIFGPLFQTMLFLVTMVLGIDIKIFISVSQIWKTIKHFFHKV